MEYYKLIFIRTHYNDGIGMQSVVIIIYCVHSSVVWEVIAGMFPTYVHTYMYKHIVPAHECIGRYLYMQQPGQVDRKISCRKFK